MSGCGAATTREVIVGAVAAALVEGRQIVGALRALQQPLGHLRPQVRFAKRGLLPQLACTSLSSFLYWFSSWIERDPSRCRVSLDDPSCGLIAQKIGMGFDRQGVTGLVKQTGEPIEVQCDHQRSSRPQTARRATVMWLQRGIGLAQPCGDSSCCKRAMTDEPSPGEIQRPQGLPGRDGTGGDMQ